MALTITFAYERDGWPSGLEILGTLQFSQMNISCSLLSEDSLSCILMNEEKSNSFRQGGKYEQRQEVETPRVAGFFFHWKNKKVFSVPKSLLKMDFWDLVLNWGLRKTKRTKSLQHGQKRDFYLRTVNMNKQLFLLPNL